MPFIAYKRGCVATVMNSVWRDRALETRRYGDGADWVGFSLNDSLVLRRRIFFLRFFALCFSLFHGRIGGVIEFQNSNHTGVAIVLADFPGLSGHALQTCL